MVKYTECIKETYAAHIQPSSFLDQTPVNLSHLPQNAMATCLEMMFTYESSSMLHASVSSAVLNILGASPPPPPPLGMNDATASAWVAETSEAAERAAKSGRREPFQRHLFEDCRLAERILEAVALNEDAEKGWEGSPSSMEVSVAAQGEGAAASAGAGDGEAGVTPGTAGAETGGERVEAPATSSSDDTVPKTDGAVGGQGAGGNVAGGGGEGDSAVARGELGSGGQPPRRGRRLGHMGHVLLLSRALVDAQNKEPREGSGDEPRTRRGGEGGEVGAGAGDSEGGTKAGRSGHGGGEEEEDADWGAATGLRKEGPATRKSFVAGLLSRRECSEQWQVSGFLVAVSFGKRLSVSAQANKRMHAFVC